MNATSQLVNDRTPTEPEKVFFFPLGPIRRTGRVGVPGLQLPAVSVRRRQARFQCVINPILSGSLIDSRYPKFRVTGLMPHRKHWTKVLKEKNGTPYWNVPAHLMCSSPNRGLSRLRVTEGEWVDHRNDLKTSRFFLITLKIRVCVTGHHSGDDHRSAEKKVD